ETFPRWLPAEPAPPPVHRGSDTSAWELRAMLSASATTRSFLHVRRTAPSPRSRRTPARLVHKGLATSRPPAKLSPACLRPGTRGRALQEGAKSLSLYGQVV